MDISRAKEETKRTIEVYLSKNEDGEYEIPINKQRPVFILGAPGIGKTAIMEQIATELNLPLVSYSMTHHTRQSAIGLPFVKQVTYGGKQYDISDYTMSEIVSSVYKMIEETGKKEGILFLDEVNCVSETLAPAMLKFLQYKAFGNEEIPNGWVVVTAGNPPEYNKSVKEFDIATLDRLKVIKIEPEVDPWKKYAYSVGIHPAITAFLDINPQMFYNISTTIDGAEFVTARGWEDLSYILKQYEKRKVFDGESSTELIKSVISQYIVHADISSKFATFYDLYNKYKRLYNVEEVLSGKVSQDFTDRAYRAEFDERVSIMSIIIEGISVKFKQGLDMLKILGENSKIVGNVSKDKLEISVRDELKSIKAKGKVGDLREVFVKAINDRESELALRVHAHTLSAKHKTIAKGVIKVLSGFIKLIDEEEEKAAKAGKTVDNAALYETIKENFVKLFNDNNTYMKATFDELENCFRFIENTWGTEKRKSGRDVKLKSFQEMTLFITALSTNQDCILYLAKYGKDSSYWNYNKSILVWNENTELMGRIQEYLDSAEDTDNN